VKDHKQVYKDHFDYCPDDIVLCEVCGAVAVDIHHIRFKSQGGTDKINNLIALCRHCHDVAHGKAAGEDLLTDTLFSIVDSRSK
jgi:5-methylcytosine-specific restriction endonuclease McrA